LTSISTSKKPTQSLSKKKSLHEWFPTNSEWSKQFNETDLEYHPFCTGIFANLEAAKREKFPKETMRVWFIEFVKRGWTKKMLLKRYEALLAKPIFGKENLEFADWVNAVPVYAEDEMSSIVNRRVDAIIQKGQFLKDKKVKLTAEDKQAIEAAIAMEIAFKYSNNRYELLDNYKALRKEKRLKELKK
jgi:hypothetical protein